MAKTYLEIQKKIAWAEEKKETESKKLIGGIK